MRKMILFSLLTVVVFAACKKKNSEECPHKSFYYTYKDNAQIDTIQLRTVINAGTKRVFNYSLYTSPCELVQDGEGGEVLQFEADPGADHFSYDNDGLTAAKCYYGEICGICGFPIMKPVTSGTIEGNKVNGNQGIQWVINVNLNLYQGLPGSRTLQFTAVFTPKQ